MNTPPLDYLIIGQGLAGSLLGWTLHRRGLRIRLIDDGHRSSASLAAAGLVNPLGGMRFNRLPHLEQCLASAEQTYRTLERELGIDLWHPIGMVRLFRDQKQIRFWERQHDNPDCQAYLGERFTPGHSGHALNDPHGGFHQHHTGYVSVAALLAALRQKFLEQGLLIESDYAPADLQLTPSGVRYRELESARVIFCEGRRVTENPWFDWLPMQPTKGEILTLHSDKPLPDKIINGRHWLLPLAEGGYKFGATLGHQHLNEEPTADGRAQLLNGLRQMLNDPPEIAVVEHRAGVRPNTSDRRPLLGAHPQHPELLVFNGFGGRGGLSIPWHADVFVDWLQGKAELPADADIRRLS